MKQGKQHWVKKRDEAVSAKGKGDIETYWLVTTDSNYSVISKSAVDVGTEGSSQLPYNQQCTISSGVFDDRTARLIDWIVQEQCQLLRKVVARRNATAAPGGSKVSWLQSHRQLALGDGHTFLDEVKEIITLPEFDHKAHLQEQDPDTIKLPKAAVEQLRDYVTCIASMYRDNPFHNFEHASHVMMSVIKLLSRIVAPSELDLDFAEDAQQAQSKLHDHTYGITSDPLSLYACAFSALIHDVDRVG